MRNRQASDKGLMRTIFNYFSILEDTRVGALLPALTKTELWNGKIL